MSDGVENMGPQTTTGVSVLESWVIDQGWKMPAAELRHHLRTETPASADEVVELLEIAADLRDAAGEISTSNDVAKPELPAVLEVPPANLNVLELTVWYADRLRARGLTNEEIAAIHPDDLRLVYHGKQAPRRDGRSGTLIAVPPEGRRSYPRTDLGNAERLVDTHGSDLRYVPALGWHAWDGSRWSPDQDGEAQRRAKLTVRAIAVEAWDRYEGKERESQVKHAIASESRAKLEAMVKLAETDSAVIARVDQLDADPYALNVRNGTVDLTTGELHEHSRTDHITKLCPIDYRPSATAPVWDRFLETIFDGDTDLIRFVQRAVGYSLTGSTDEQVLFLLHGRGQNGKSTFIETVAAMLGDYAQQAPAEMLMQQSRARGGATPDLARLPGARFVSAVETGEGRRIDEPLVKQLTGGDKIAARPLYKNVFEFTPTHKLWLATNHLPQIAGTDDAIWRRIRLIPFAVRIPDADKDVRLKQKLEGELPGIVNWALAGCSSWLAEGLGVPASVTNATDAYRADMDELGAFIEEWCDIGNDGQAKASELLTLYGYWAAANSASPITANQLSKSLVERGFQKHRVTDGVVYRGLKIASHQQQSLN